ncbi:type II toxin-antitoxin system Phd/YefM family antitoxin [Scrofimicrobium canadense]|nr:type II toxin-antitoxin system Phd/YefM family antitoxin [Scrofimicrobium canadense]
MSNVWQLQEAKQRLSEVIRQVEAGYPQVITKNGRNVAVIVEYDGFQKMTGGPEPLSAFLARSAGEIDVDMDEYLETRRTDPERHAAMAEA